MSCKCILHSPQQCIVSVHITSELSTCTHLHTACKCSSSSCLQAGDYSDPFAEADQREMQQRKAERARAQAAMTNSSQVAAQPQASAPPSSAPQLAFGSTAIPSSAPATGPSLLLLWPSCLLLVLLLSLQLLLLLSAATAAVAATATTLHCQSSTHEPATAACIGCQLPCIPSRQISAAAALFSVMHIRHVEMRPYLQSGS